MTKNKHKDTKSEESQKNDQSVRGKKDEKKSFLGKNKVLLIKMGFILIAAAIVAMVIAIVTNQALFQEFLRVL